MALKSGLAAQVGLKTESTWGTAVTVDRFTPLISESMTEKIERLESSGIAPGARVLRSGQWATGNVEVAGDLGFELYQQGMGLWFRHMFGAVSTSGAGPYTHTFTPGDMSDDHFTLQIGKPDVGGTVQPFTYAGCKVTEWELAAKAGELVTLGVSVVGRDLATATSLATASYGIGSGLPFSFAHASVTVGGSAAFVKEITLKGSNGLATDRRGVGSPYLKEPLEAELRTYEGEMVCEFESLAQMNLFRNGTENALVLTIDAGSAAKCVITTNVRYDGSTPEVQGRGVTELKMPFKCLGPSTDADAITAVLTNSDATPT